MDVANDLNRGLKLQKNGLIGENVLGSQTKIYNVLFTYFNILISIRLFGIDAYFLILFQV